jgi:hypothetical protein
MSLPRRPGVRVRTSLAIDSFRSGDLTSRRPVIRTRDRRAAGSRATRRHPRTSPRALCFSVYDDRARKTEDSESYEHALANSSEERRAGGPR